MDEREDRGGGADAERQRENGGDGEAGCFEELPQRVADIVKHETSHLQIVIRGSGPAVPNLHQRGPASRTVAAEGQRIYFFGKSRPVQFGRLKKEGSGVSTVLELLQNQGQLLRRRFHRMPTRADFDFYS